MKQQYIVSDTNIFIDLMEVGLFDTLFLLPWEINTTDFVLDELIKPKQRDLADKYVDNNVLKVKRNSLDELEMLCEFFRDVSLESNLSIADCSVWMLAQELKCPLLTGDGKLRKIAEGDIEVHGVLYVFEQFVAHGLLDRNSAIQQLTKLMAINPRLPQKEAEETMRRWAEEDD